MIDASSILLDLDYIFTDVSTCETILVGLPLKREGQEAVELGAFFKNIMFTTQFDQTENCDHVAKLINYLNSTPVFSLVDFKGLLEEIKGNAQAAAAVAAETVVQPAIVPPAMAAASQSSLPLQQEPADAVQPVISPQPISSPQPAAPPQPVPLPQPAFYTQGAPQGQTMNFGETTVLVQGNIGETTVLSAIQDQAVQQPYLIRSRNNEKKTECNKNIHT